MDKEAELALKRSRLSQAGKALLAKRLQSSLQQQSSYTLLPRRTSHQNPLLSFAQQRLWFLEQLSPGNSFYTMPLLIDMEGVLDVSVLARCLQELIQRHEVLRTNFMMHGDEPLQIVTTEEHFSLPIVDLQELSLWQRQQTVQRLAHEDAKRSFDLKKGPLIRYTLLRLQTQKHLLLFTIHHIICDGWSLAIMYRELTTLYEAFLKGQTSPLSPLPIQYIDFALWQRDWLQGEVLQKQLVYWRQHLADLMPLELPTDHPRPPVQTYQSAALHFTLPVELINKIHAFCRREEITPFIFFLAVFQTLLAHYTGQDDIAIGTPISGRTRAELEDLVGFFVNTLVMRTSLAGNPRLHAILQRVRDVVSTAFNNQDVPFERLVEELQPERNMSQTPLIQALFTLKVPLEPVRTIDQLSLRSWEQGSEASHFDLMLTVSEEQGILEYCTDLFEESTMHWLIQAYETLLMAFVTTPDQSFGDLSLLGEAQRQQVLTAWNATQMTVTSSPGICLHQAFEMQAEQIPDAVALVSEDYCLTYIELNRRSNQVAHYLQHLEIMPGERVGIFFERSLAAIIAILGTLKAGAVYVPLDPAYPQERLALMLTSARIGVLLTCEDLRDQLPQSEIQAVYLGTDAPELAGQSTANPSCMVCGDDLAYIIFTSGTTGQPKGAGVYHRGLMNLLQWYISTFEMNKQDRDLVVTSLSFDLTQKNLLAPLLVGGIVCLHATRYYDIPLLLQYIEQYAITLLNCTPSMFYPVVDEYDDLYRLRYLRYLFLGGESIAVRRFQHWFEHSDCHVEIVNTYGPTECSDVVAFYRLRNPLQFLDVAPPLGGPVANTQLLILNKHLQPVPPIVQGEVYIAGICVGGGYVNDEQLTRDRFIPNPFPEISGTVLYRTGDLARYRPDGLIEYVGRSDQQVKIRGFRIEPGEIETVLERHAKVRKCVVHIWIDEVGEKYLVAYIISNSQTPLASELRAYLRTCLPTYMVPTFFVVLDKLPLTPSGKVDRRSLPAPRRNEYASRGALRDARTPIEEVVASIYRDILQVEKIELQDNFFDLGGHSLLATRVVSRLRTLLQVEMPLRSLFEAPVVDDFSRRVEQKMRGEQDDSYRPLVPVERSQLQQQPLSFAQQRIWFLHQVASEASTYVLPVVIRVQGALDISLLEKCLHVIVQRHENLRTVFIDRTQQPVQVVQEMLPIALELVEARYETFQQALQFVSYEIKKRMEQPFDLQYGPLLRAGVFHIHETEHVFFLIFHHIIFDGWSIGILLRELATLYEAFAQGDEPVLSPLPIQYIDFACWQRERLQGEALANLSHYWKEQLRGAVALELSRSQPDALQLTNHGAGLAFALSEKLSKDVMALSRREEVTLFTTLLAALQLLLYRTTGQRDVIVGTDIANRTREETEDLIGFFVNLLPLRTQFRSQEAFRAALKRVRTTVLDAYAHQELPFEKIVDTLQLERSGRQIPLIKVLFVWQNIPLPALRFQGLELSLLEEESEVSTAKFDLALFMMEKEGILTGLFNYRTDLFSQQEIAHLRAHFNVLLQSIVDAPDMVVEDLEIFTENEKKQRLYSETSQQENQRRKLKMVKRQMLTLSDDDHH